MAFLVSISLPARAEGGATFREQFIKNRDANKFKEQVALVKKNKDVMPAEVGALIEEAMERDKEFSERMDLLDLASAMASMHKFWNRDEGPLKLLEPYIRNELRAEEKREAEVMRWTLEERFLGNFVMMRYNKELAKEDLPPVLYPHWLHRIYYECRVCHDSVFRMKRFSSDITQGSFEEGRLCGVCHDGKEAFAPKGNCRRCHLAGTPEAEKFHDPTMVDHKEIKRIAGWLGAEWNYENLNSAGLPLDKFRFIDWLRLEELGVTKPKASLSITGEEKDKSASEKRNNIIYFPSSTSAVKDVVFNHKIHTDLIACKSCHPEPFSEELGKSDVRMSEFSKGRFCGACHGRVSFTFKDCKRCHHHNSGEVPEGALIRKGKK